MRHRFAAIAIGLVASLPASAQEMEDPVGAPAAASGLATPALKDIERRIVKEPVYSVGPPLYGLLVIGPAAKTRVWLVLDREKKGDRYNVLYADLNGNGDLTEAGERFGLEAKNTEGRFRLPDLKDPAGDAAHTAFSVRVSDLLDPTIMVSMAWRGGFRLGGGYAEIPSNGGYMKFAAKPRFAPILSANGDGPFRFQTWCSSELTIGAADDLKVFLGQQGLGPSSFCAFQEHVLPDGEGVQATLIYRDAAGKEQRTSYRLNDRC